LLADSAKSALRCVGLAGIFLAGAVVARFVALARDTFAWVFDTATILADFAGVAARARGDTYAIAGAADLTIVT
jgi:hypothetical protein